MLKIITEELPEEDYNIMYQTYYKFFLNMDGFLADKIFKNSSKNPIKKSAHKALDSLKQDNIAFYLYYLDNLGLISFGRIYKHDQILHLGEMLFTEDEDQNFIISLIIPELEIYAKVNNYKTLEVEIPKANTELINLAIDHGYDFVKENPETAAIFKTYVLYKDIYERTNSSKQRNR